MNKWINYILLSRPYTLPSIVLVATLASILARGGLVVDFLIVSDIIFALCVWTSMVYLNEAFHRDRGRIKVPFSIPAIFYIIALIIAVFRNYFTVAFLILALLSTIIYKFKSINWPASSFVFLFRGFVEFSIFLSVLLFYSATLTTDILLIALILFLITDSRNLVGDLRDMAVDKYTLPKKYGVAAAYAVSLAFIVAVILLTPSLGISVPLIIIFVLMVLNRNDYIMHHLFVITTSFYLLNYISYLLSYDLLIINFAYIAVLLSWTYKFVPRMANIGNNLGGPHY